MPKVSIVIPTYNSARYLGETLESIFNQSYQNYEIIVVDDGSTDDTKNILEPFADKIVYIYQENSGAPAKPRNVGISRSSGDYISIFDSDDIMAPFKIERSIAFLNSYPDLGMIFNNFIKFNDFGQYPEPHLNSNQHFWRLKKTRVGNDEFVIPKKEAFEGLFYSNYIGTSGVVVPKRVFEEIGWFDESVSKGGLEDRDMWFRITKNFDIGFLNIVGHRYRVRSNSVSKRIISSNEARIKVIGRYMAGLGCRRTIWQAKTVIAKCYSHMGYHYKETRHLAKSRRFYVRSLNTALNIRAIRGLMITLLNPKMVLFFKGIRDFGK
jgi:glycosyltransferase involved in cell wall biosynthesis